MKKITLSIATLSLCLSAGAQTLDRSIRPKPGPAPVITLGKTESFTLPNGMKVFVVENHKLPAVSYTIQLDVKPMPEASKAGLSDVVGDLLTAGTKTRTSEKLASEIDMIGANINASAEGIRGSALKKHQTKLLELMSDIALNAKPAEAELAKTKTKMLSGMAAESNEPDAMLRNVTQVVNFGMQHPYGEIATPTTAKNITLSDVTSYINTYFRPNVAYMAVVGDVTLAEVKPLIEKYFGSWKKAEVPRATYAKVIKPNNTNVVFVPRDAAVQSVVNVTYPIDMKPGAPDAIKAQVTNAILGNGSQGRLFLNLRETHGWTYGSYSDVDIDPEIGSFTAYAKCRNAVTDSSVAEILSEMQRLNTEAVSNEELQARIAYMSGGFAIGLEDPSRVAQYAINIERYGLPKDYYQNYLRNLAAVSVADVQSMSAKYVKPQFANIIVVGDKSLVAPKLVRFDADGIIDYRDNYGMPIKVETTQAAPAGTTAEDIRKNYVDAIGGRKAIEGLKSMKIVYTAEMQGMKLSRTELKKGGKLRSEMSMNGQPMQTLVFDGTKGYQSGMGQKKDLEAGEIMSTKMQADLQAELHDADYKTERTLAGKEGDMYVIEATEADGKKSKEYYDATTGLLLKSVSTQEGPQGPMSMTMGFSNYKEIPGSGGYKTPYTVSIEGMAPVPITMEITEVVVNKEIADSEFE